MATREAIEHAGMDTIFQNVYLFVEQAKDIASLRRDKLVRQNLATCLKGTALGWYTSKVIPDQKWLLRLGQGIDKWKLKLVTQFKERPNMAMAAIVRERYTLTNAQNRRKPREYVGVIIRGAKSAELGSIGHIIMLIYNSLKLKF